jgi:hypothetical protein
MRLSYDIHHSSDLAQEPSISPTSVLLRALASASEPYPDPMIKSGVNCLYVLRGAAVQTDDVMSVAVGASVTTYVNNSLLSGLSQVAIDRSREELL